MAEKTREIDMYEEALEEYEDSFITIDDLHSAHGTFVTHFNGFYYITSPCIDVVTVALDNEARWFKIEDTFVLRFPFLRDVEDFLWTAVWNPDIYEMELNGVPILCGDAYTEGYGLEGQHPWI